MSDSDSIDPFAFDELAQASDTARTNANALSVSATQFANAMRKAFTDAVSGGKEFDDVLKSLALRLSNLALANAFKPLAKQLADGWGGLFEGGALAPPVASSVLPFASGGAIGAPSYFPLPSGGLGLAGEAGPEAIVPLARASDGRLGVSMGGAAPVSVTVQIATPDLANFKRSEAYLSGQIARAVARGQRGF